MVSNILVLNPDFVGESMAGPAIRYCELSRVLSAKHNVTMGIPNSSDYSLAGVKVAIYGADNLESLIELNDIIVVSGSFNVLDYPFLKRTTKMLVVDLYAPQVLEDLELVSRREARDKKITALNDLMSIGDFFICASERQRDFWLGVLTALHRVDLAAYQKDRSLRSLIDIVAFGLPAEKPQHNQQVLKGVHPGIEKDDTVLIWAGGIYDWFDVKSLIIAMEKIGKVAPTVKLFFMGVKHPNPNTIKMRAVEEAISLSKELDVFDKTVFFNDWVPYKERANYLLEADIGLSIHYDHLETRFSFRTRMLDYIWAAVPIICTRGDTLADVVEDSGIGKTIAPKDPSGLAAAILDFVNKPEDLAKSRSALREVQKEYSWSYVARPLLSYCDQPQRTRRKVTADVSPEDSAIKIQMMEQMIIDKNRHIYNLENIISSYNEFPGSWLHLVTRAYRRVFKRKAGGKGAET